MIKTVLMISIQLEIMKVVQYLSVCVFPSYSRGQERMRCSLSHDTCILRDVEKHKHVERNILVQMNFFQCKQKSAAPSPQTESELVCFMKNRSRQEFVILHINV